MVSAAMLRGTAQAAWNREEIERRSTEVAGCGAGWEAPRSQVRGGLADGRRGGGWQRVGDLPELVVEGGDAVAKLTRAWVDERRAADSLIQPEHAWGHQWRAWEGAALPHTSVGMHVGGVVAVR